jgi:hypothetical protein
LKSAFEILASRAIKILINCFMEKVITLLSMEAPGVEHKALGRMELQQEHTFLTDLVKCAGFHVTK